MRKIIPLLALFLLISNTYASAEVLKTDTDPSIAYHQAWNIVNQEYYDSKFGGEDWYAWKDKFVGRLKNSRDCKGALFTMLSSLRDPDTQLKLSNAFKFRLPDDAFEAGIGVSLAMNKKDQVVISEVFKGYPAEESNKIKVGAILIAIDGEDVQDLAKEVVGYRLRGKSDTTVSIMLADDSGEPYTVTLRRKALPVNEIVCVEQFGDVGYIYGRETNKNPANEMKKHLAMLKSCKKIVLDLRCMNGTSSEAILDVASIFAEKGKYLGSVWKQNGLTMYTASGGSLNGAKLAVLIDSETEQAAEMLALVLKESCGAILVGEPSAGRGRIVKHFELMDKEEIFVTVAKFLTTKGNEINRGIEPDVRISGTEFWQSSNDGPWFRSVFHKISLADKQFNEAIKSLSVGQSP